MPEQADVHVIPTVEGEPTHDERHSCWCGPVVRNAIPPHIVIHRCFTKPDANDVTGPVEGH